MSLKNAPGFALLALSCAATVAGADTEGFDPLAVVAPPPKPGSARDDADRRIFRETRVLKDSPRWQMARGDDALDAHHMLSHFACAMELDVEPEQAPHLVDLLQRTTREATRGVGTVKDFYQRKRPFFIDEGPTCLPKVNLAASFDYPSGHSAAGWSWALLLSEVAPSRATAFLVRGRAIGESRVVCGVHNASSVEASRLLVGAALGPIVTRPGFQSELDAARDEYQRLHADPQVKRPDPAACRAESKLLSMPLPGLSDAGYPSASPAR